MDVSSNSNLESFFRDVNDHHLASTLDDHELRPKQQQLVQGKEDHQTDQQHNVGVPVRCRGSLGLKLEIPSLKEDHSSSNEGLKTPTSPEHKIPVNLPPAPRKPKPRPSTKRKGCRPRIVIDVSQEIESLFPVDIGAGGKNKKVKLFTN